MTFKCVVFKEVQHHEQDGAGAFSSNSGLFGRRQVKVVQHTHLKDEDSVCSYIMKMWDLGKTDKRTGTPVLLRAAKGQPTGKPHPVRSVLATFLAWTHFQAWVSSVALTSTLSFLSVGLADGTVILYRRLDQSLSSTSSAPIPKPHVIHEIATEPVTFLTFITAPPSVSMDPFSSTSVSDTSDPGSSPIPTLPPTLPLVIVTTSSTYVYLILLKSSSHTPILIDEVGVGLRCTCVDWKSRWVVLGRDEAVVGSGSGGRLGVVSYEGQ